MRLLLLLTAVLAWCGSAAALQCYACHSSKPIPGVKLDTDITRRLASFPPCTVLQKEGVADKFKQRCGPRDKSCVKIVDPADSTNELRSCLPLSRDECKGSACYCTGELCNAAPAGWPSAAALAAALVALLLGR